MNLVPADSTWRKSSYSGEEGSSLCVEVTRVTPATTEEK
ncbi:DUF397 domain-containing protein [Actinoallomurus liliacearum]